MKFMRTLFQIALLLACPLIVSQPLRAASGDTFQGDTQLAAFVPPTQSDLSLRSPSAMLAAIKTLPTTALSAQSAPATKSTHRSASMMLAGLETGFMGNIVPLVALLLIGRAAWMLMPSRRMEAESVPAPRLAWEKPAWAESQSMAGRALASLREFGRPIWQWMMAPTTETRVVEEEPRVNVPPLRHLPERITIF